MPIRISRFDSVKDNLPKPQTLEWEEFVGLISTHVERPTKDGPAWSPAVYPPNATRGNRNVEAVSLATFDIDHVTTAEAEACDKAIQASGFDAVIHSTHNHSAEDIALRLIVNISRDLTPGEWKQLRSALITRLRIPADPATSDAGRLYLLPSKPPGAQSLVEVYKGAPADVDSLLGTASKARALSQTLGPVDTYEVRAIIRKVRDPEIVALFKPILDATPLAPPGQRDATMNRVATHLALRLPPETPWEALAAVVRPSLEAMDSDLGIEAELDKFQEKYERALKRKNELNAEAAQLKADRKRLRQDKPEAAFSETFDYTPEQLAQWAKEQGTTVEGFRHRWMIQRADAHFIFVDGTYQKPISSKELSASLPRDLARAPVEFTFIDSKGNPKPRKASQMMDEYGSVARSLSSSLVLQRSYYDAKTQTFYEATCPLRSFSSTHHPHVQGWLETMGGTNAPKLLDWVASVTRLDYQCAALFLHGEPGSGKGLFTDGLAALWREGGPTEVASIAGGFNDSLATCPLIFVDEGFPNGYSIQDEIRRLVGSSQRNLSRKFMPTSTLHGAVRLIIAANNDRIMDNLASLSEQDRQALYPRLLYIPIDASPKAYLDSLTREQTSAMLSHQIAEHALWLRDNRQVIPGSRFIVEGVSSQFHDRLSVMHGRAPDVLRFLAATIDGMTPQKAKTYSDNLRVGNGEIWVSDALFNDELAWKSVLPGSRMPSSSVLNDTLASLRSRPASVPRGDKVLNFHVIHSRLLLTWATTSNTYDAAFLAKIINAPNPEMESK